MDRKKKSAVCFLSPNREPAAAQNLRVHTKKCPDLLFLGDILQQRLLSCTKPRRKRPPHDMTLAPLFACWSYKSHSCLTC